MTRTIARRTVGHMFGFHPRALLRRMYAAAPMWTCLLVIVLIPTLLYFTIVTESYLLSLTPSNAHGVMWSVIGLIATIVYILALVALVASLLASPVLFVWVAYAGVRDYLDSRQERKRRYAESHGLTKDES